MVLVHYEDTSIPYILLFFYYMYSSSISNWLSSLRFQCSGPLCLYHHPIICFSFGPSPQIYMTTKRPIVDALLSSFSFLSFFYLTSYHP